MEFAESLRPRRRPDAPPSDSSNDSGQTQGFKVFTDDGDEDKPKYNPSFFSSSTYDKKGGPFRVTTPQPCCSCLCVLIVLFVLTMLTVLVVVLVRSTGMYDQFKQSVLNPPQQPVIQNQAATAQQQPRQQPQQPIRAQQPAVVQDNDQTATQNQQGSTDDVETQQQEPVQPPPKPVQPPKRKVQPAKQAPPQAQPIPPPPPAHEELDAFLDGDSLAQQQAQMSKHQPPQKKRMSETLRTKSNTLLRKVRENVVKTIRVPVMTVEHHTSVVNFWMQLAKQATPEKQFTVLLFTSAPYLNVPSKPVPEATKTASGNSSIAFKDIQPFLTDDNYLLTMAYYGLVNKIVWLRPLFASAHVPKAGQYTFNIGKSGDSNLLVVDNVDVSRLFVNYAPTSTLRSAKRVTFEIVDLDDSFNIDHFAQHFEHHENTLLDMDLNFFSAENPYKEWAMQQFSHLNDKQISSLLQLIKPSSYCFPTANKENAIVLAGQAMRALSAFSQEHVNFPQKKFDDQVFLNSVKDLMSVWCAGPEAAKQYFLYLKRFVTNLPTMPHPDIVHLLYTVAYYPHARQKLRFMEGFSRMVRTVLTAIFAQQQAKPDLISVSRSIENGLVAEKQWPVVEEILYEALIAVYKKPPPPPVDFVKSNKTQSAPHADNHEQELLQQQQQIAASKQAIPRKPAAPKRDDFDDVLDSAKSRRAPAKNKPVREEDFDEVLNTSARKPTIDKNATARKPPVRQDKPLKDIPIHKDGDLHDDDIFASKNKRAPPLNPKDNMKPPLRKMPKRDSLDDRHDDELDEMFHDNDPKNRRRPPPRRVNATVARPPSQRNRMPPSDLPNRPPPPSQRRDNFPPDDFDDIFDKRDNRGPVPPIKNMPATRPPLQPRRPINNGSPDMRIGRRPTNPMDGPLPNRPIPVQREPPMRRPPPRRNNDLDDFHDDFHDDFGPKKPAQRNVPPPRNRIPQNTASDHHDDHQDDFYNDKAAPNRRQGANLRPPVPSVQQGRRPAPPPRTRQPNDFDDGYDDRHDDFHDAAPQQRQPLRKQAPPMMDRNMPPPRQKPIRQQPQNQAPLNDFDPFHDDDPAHKEQPEFFRTATSDNAATATQASQPSPHVEADHETSASHATGHEEGQSAVSGVGASRQQTPATNAATTTSTSGQVPSGGTTQDQVPRQQQESSTTEARFKQATPETVPQQNAASERGAPTTTSGATTNAGSGNILNQKQPDVKVESIPKMQAGNQQQGQVPPQRRRQRGTPKKDDLDADFDDLDEEFVDDLDAHDARQPRRPRSQQAPPPTSAPPVNKATAASTTTNTQSAQPQAKMASPEAAPLTNTAATQTAAPQKQPAQPHHDDVHSDPFV